MLLSVDVGNSNTVFAVHDGEVWRGRWRSGTDSMRTADEYIGVLSQWLALKGLVVADIEDCIISTVVPQARFHLINLSRVHLGIEPYLVGENVDVGIPVRNIDRPSEVGADRLVNAVGAFDRHGGPLVVIDSGTATTFDVIGSDGGFEGGVIAPGISLSMRALHDASARLPRVDIGRPARDRVIGHDTVSAMRSGVFWGYMSLIDGLVGRIREEYCEPLKVVATGGVVSIFRDAAESVDIYDSDVTIHGLLTLYRRSSAQDSR